MREIMTPYDTAEMDMERPGVCPVCGAPVYSEDTAYMDRRGEVLGCEACVKERTWGDVA